MLLKLAFKRKILNNMMRKIKRKNQDQQKETKQRYASCKNLDIVTKSKIEQKNTKQHQIGRINLDRFIKRKNHYRKKKQHQKKKQKKKNDRKTVNVEIIFLKI